MANIATSNKSSAISFGETGSKALQPQASLLPFPIILTAGRDRNRLACEIRSPRLPLVRRLWMVPLTALWLLILQPSSSLLPVSSCTCFCHISEYYQQLPDENKTLSALCTVGLKRTSTFFRFDALSSRLPRCRAPLHSWPTVWVT